MKSQPSDFIEYYSRNKSGLKSEFGPEEAVRQGFVRYLTRVLNIPANSLILEKGINDRSCRGEKPGQDRPDLIIKKNGKGLLVVEFKSDTSSLYQQAYLQGRRYLEKLRVPYLMICNGKMIRLYESSGDALNRLKVAPAMLSEFKGERIADEPKPDFDEKYFRLGTTPEWAVPYLRVLQNKIIYSSVVGERVSDFKVVSDLGLEDTTFKNASGSKGVMGVYHFYEIEFNDHRREVVGITIIRYDRPIAGMKPGNKLVVGIGSKSCMEIKTGNQFISERKGRVILTHNGSIVGISGLDKNTVKQLLQRRIPNIYDTGTNSIVFGVIDARTKEAMWNSIILNMISYAIEREKIKVRYKAKIQSVRGESYGERY